MGKIIGRRIRHARLAQGLTQADVAAKLDVSQATVSNWEKGKSEPDRGERAELERILGTVGRPQGGRDAEADDEDSDGTEAALFGDWLRKAREAAGLSTFELAERSGVSNAQLLNLESGRSLNPREATRRRLEKALKKVVPDEVQEEVEEGQKIEGLGALTDFDPHDPNDRPTCPGVYVFYDVSERPVYVGKAQNIKARVAGHTEKFWFKAPIVNNGAFVEIDDAALRHQIEQILIRFLKSNAVINRQSVERD